MYVGEMLLHPTYCLCCFSSLQTLFKNTCLLRVIELELLKFRRLKDALDVPLRQAVLPHLAHHVDGRTLPPVLRKRHLVGRVRLEVCMYVCRKVWGVVCGYIYSGVSRIAG